MNKTKAKQLVVKYLHERNIPYSHYVADGELSLAVVLKGHEKCPDGLLECCFYFYETCMEARVYFDENASNWISARADKLPELYRLLNYINARFWPFNNDGTGWKVYSPHHLITPRFYLAEGDKTDLTATMAIDYDVFELAPLEVCDYITATLPAYMNELSRPVFLVVLGDTSAEDAIELIESIMIML